MLSAAFSANLIHNIYSELFSFQNKINQHFNFPGIHGSFSHVNVSMGRIILQAFQKSSVIIGSTLHVKQYWYNSKALLNTIMYFQISIKILKKNFICLPQISPWIISFKDMFSIQSPFLIGLVSLAQMKYNTIQPISINNQIACKQTSDYVNKKNKSYSSCQREWINDSVFFHILEKDSKAQSCFFIHQQTHELKYSQFTINHIQKSISQRENNSNLSVLCYNQNKVKLSYEYIPCINIINSSHIDAGQLGQALVQLDNNQLQLSYNDNNNNNNQFQQQRLDRPEENQLNLNNEQNQSDYDSFYQEMFEYALINQQIISHGQIINDIQKYDNFDDEIFRLGEDSRQQICHRVTQNDLQQLVQDFHFQF